MEQIRFTKLDGGTIEERIAEAKAFLGLKPEQTFQYLEFDEYEQDDGLKKHTD